MDYKESITPAFLNSTVTQYGSHMVMTNVQKRTKTKIVNIDTRFLDEYQVNTNTYPITLSDKITHVKSLKVVSAEIPVSYYNISSALGNNYFMLTMYGGYDISGGGGSFTTFTTMITVPDGNYTITTLNTTIYTLLSSIEPAGNSFDIQFVNTDTTGNNGNTTIVLGNGGTTNVIKYKLRFDFAVNRNGEFDKYNFKNKLGWLLGFRNTTYVFSGTYNSSVGAVTLLTSEAFSNINNIQRYLYLVVDDFNNGQQNSFLSSLPTSLINKNIIARITPNTAFGSVIYANCGNGLLYSDCREYTSKIDIQRLNVQLINEVGQNLLLNGLDFSFCMEIEYE